MKIKTLIFTLLFTLISLGSFVSASIFPNSKTYFDWFHKNGGDYYYENGSFVPSFTSFGCDGNGTIQGSIDYGNIKGESFTFNCPGYFSSYKGQEIKKFGYIAKGSGSPKIYIESSSSPNGVISPAISGFQDVVFQLLPLFVYLSIGLLLYTITFVAIRWLMNWLGGKIKVIFSSKHD